MGLVGTAAGEPEANGREARNRAVTQRLVVGIVGTEMSTNPAPVQHEQSLELPVEELLRRVRPAPPPEEFVIDDLTPEEGEAFLEAVRS